VRILGIDPGTIRTGWAVVEPWGPRARAIGYGVIAAGQKRPLPERLARIHDALVAVIEEHAPGAVAVEDIFFAKYPNAALKLGHARGVALLVAAKAQLEVFAYEPALIKRTVAGRGRADKAQVAALVRAALKLDETPQTDASDALAVGLTHVQAMRSRSAQVRRPRRK